MVDLPGRNPASRRAATRVAVCLLLAAGAAACGKRGPPLLPEPRGPLPPLEVAARQFGEQIIVAFEVPQPRGPRVAQQPVRAELVRVDYAPGVEAPPDPDAFRRRGDVVAIREDQPLDSGARLQLADSSQVAVGWTLRYGVRVLDRRGRSSPLVVARDLVPVEPPPAPSGLSAEATADGVRLTWKPPAGLENSRFNLYRSQSGEVPAERPLNAAPLTTPEFLDSEVEVGRTYEYQIRTTAADEPPFRESASNPTVSVLAQDRFAPAAPQGLVVVQEGSAVRLFWNPNEERDLSGYRVYRRKRGGEWIRIGPDPVTESLYLDDAVSVGDQLAYYITAVDRASPPNESSPSETAEVNLAAEPPAGEGGGR